MLQMQNRAVGRSENQGVPVLFGGHNLPYLFNISEFFPHIFFLILLQEENQDGPPAGLPDKEDLSKMSAATLQQEFELDSVFDYLKTGIGSIIEDEVTQRFVAEELKVSSK